LSAAPESPRHAGWNGGDQDRRDAARDAGPRLGHDAGPGHSGDPRVAREGDLGARGDTDEEYIGRDGSEEAPDTGLLSAPVRLPVPGIVEGKAASRGVVRRPVAVLLATAAVVVAVAAVLPWSELSSGDETRTLTGLAVGDGRLTGMLAAVLAWVGCAAAAGRRAFAADVVVAQLAAVGVVAVTAFDVVFGPPTMSSVRGISAAQIAVRAEVGVVLSLVAGLVALLAAALLRRR
jgi:hypothetical protein